MSLDYEIDQPGFYQAITGYRCEAGWDNSSYLKEYLRRCQVIDKQVVENVQSSTSTDVLTIPAVALTPNEDGYDYWLIWVMTLGGEVFKAGAVVNKYKYRIYLP